jgi:uncharacterized membrane protein YqaE (UPF0057 family)
VSLVALLLAFSNAYALPNRAVEQAPTLEGIQFLEGLGLEELANLSVSDFLELTPKSIQEKTGHKLSIKETLALKAAQKKMKKAMKAADGSAPDEDDKILIYVLAFLLPPLAVFLCYEMEDNKFLVNLILTLLCFLPGVIHALVVCSRYFNGR